MSRDTAGDKGAVRGLLRNWAPGVRAKDPRGIRVNHCSDTLMFDAPPPPEVQAIDAYRRTSDLFYSRQAESRLISSVWTLWFADSLPGRVT